MTKDEQIWPYYSRVETSAENTQYLLSLGEGSVNVMGPGQISGECDPQVLELNVFTYSRE